MISQYLNYVILRNKFFVDEDDRYIIYEVGQYCILYQVSSKYSLCSGLSSALTKPSFSGNKVSFIFLQIPKRRLEGYQRG